MAEPESPPPDPGEVLPTRRFLVVLAIAAVVGVVASLVAWGFLEGLHELQDLIFTDLPEDMGFDSTPWWWYLPVLAIAGVITAFAIARLPGRGGHIPAEGLSASPTVPIDLPGVVLAAGATIGLGLVLGPEAPLIALGGGLGFLAIRLIRRDAPEQLGNLIASSGTFAAVSFLFGSPIIAAVILIEATGLGGRRLPIVLVPGLLASGIGSLVSVGMGSWTGVDTADISLDLLRLPHFPRPDVIDFLWTVPLAVAVALVAFVIFAVARRGVGLSLSRPYLILPVVGLAVAGCAIGFSESTDKGAHQVLFSGQDAIGPLVENPSAWSLSDLALVIGFKGVAYTLCLASFRGGPVFPAMFLGAAGGLAAAGLPGCELTPAVAVCMGAAVVAVLRLPLSAIVLAVVLTSTGGLGAGPLIILGVVVAYLVTLALDRLVASRQGGGSGAAAPAPA